MKRRLLDYLFYSITTLLTLIPIIILTAVLRFVYQNGASVLYQQLTGVYQNVSLESDKLLQMIVSTLMLIGMTLLLILPFSILAAIYLNEYALESSWAKLVRFCVEILASIPSIVYGLFGMLVFVRILGFGMSIIAGSLTLSLMLLPIMMRQTEEALKQVSSSYREASSALGATQFETIKNVVIPSAVPGILVGVLLTIGRIIGESAALLFTVGSFVRMPIDRETGLLSVLESGTTLTIRAIIEFKEYGNLEAAAAIGIITIGVAILLNLVSKMITAIFIKDSSA